MNINAAPEGVRVLRLEPTQPDDPGNHGIAPGRVRPENFTGKAAVVKNGADRSVIANLLGHLQVTQRSRHPSPEIAQAIFGSGNRVDRHLGAMAHDHQFLIAHTNDHAIQRLLNRRGQRQKRGRGRGRGRNGGSGTSDRARRSHRHKEQQQEQGAKHARSSTR